MISSLVPGFNSIYIGRGTKNSEIGDDAFILQQSTGERFSERAGLPCKMKCYLPFNSY